MKKYAVFLILFTVFLLTVLLRLQQITPVVKTHDQTYILTLQTCEIWEQQGITNCHFTPMWTYHNAGDKKMAYYKRLEDEQGNNFYVSFPPFSFILAYIILIPFGVDDGKIILQIFNLILHFFSAYIIYLLACVLLKQEKNRFSFPAFTAFIVYLFTPAMLFLHADIFFPEMTALVLWILTVFIFLRLKENSNTLKYILFFTVLFLFLYTEWLAVFFIFSISIYLFFLKKYPNKGKLIILSATALISAAVIMFIQYASISGWSNLLHAMGIRFLERSGFFGQKYSSMGVHLLSLDSLKLFFLNIHKTLSWSGYILIILFIAIFVRKRKWLSPNTSLIFFAILSPLIIHWLVFFNANALHLMLMPRLIFPLSISVAFISNYFIQKYNASLRVKYFVIFLCLVFTFYSAYSYNNGFIFNEKYHQLYEVGSFIKNNSASKQALFIQSQSHIPEPEKYLTYTTKRNIVRVANQKQAIEYLKNRNLGQDAIIFNIDTIRYDGSIPYLLFTTD